MVRRYTDEPVPPESVDRILEAAVRAPSAGFSQGQRFVVVTDPDSRARIATAGGEAEHVAKGFDPWLSVAPVHIVVCVDKEAYHERYREPDKASTQAWQIPYWWVDAGASLMAILYAAVDEGLAAGLLGGHAFDGLHNVLAIPAEIDIIGLVTIGHPALDRPSTSVGRGRVPLSTSVHWDRW